MPNLITKLIGERIDAGKNDEALFAEPLADARKRLNISTPETYYGILRAIASDPNVQFAAKPGAHAVHA